jgi:hypothetical protein
LLISIYNSLKRFVGTDKYIEDIISALSNLRERNSMALNESDTRAKLITPALHSRGRKFESYTAHHSFLAMN